MDPSLYAETQNLVVKLTNEVGRLRSERNSSRASFESLSEEHVRVVERSKTEEDAHRTKVSEMEIKLASMYTLYEKLEEKSEKLKTICELQVLEGSKKVADLERDKVEMAEAMKREIYDRESAEDVRKELVGERDDAILHNRKLIDYITEMEMKLGEYHYNLRREAARVHAFRQKLILAYDELQLLGKIVPVSAFCETTLYD